MARENDRQNKNEPMEPRTVRLAQSDWDRLEKACVARRKRTGRNATRSELVQEMVSIGLAQIERTGELMVVV